MPTPVQPIIIPASVRPIIRLHGSGVLQKNQTALDCCSLPRHEIPETCGVGLPRGRCPRCSDAQGMVFGLRTIYTVTSLKRLLHLQNRSLDFQPLQTLEPSVVTAAATQSMKNTTTAITNTTMMLTQLNGTTPDPAASTSKDTGFQTETDASINDGIWNEFIPSMLDVSANFQDTIEKTSEDPTETEKPKSTPPGGAADELRHSTPDPDPWGCKDDEIGCRKPVVSIRETADSSCPDDPGDLESGLGESVIQYLVNLFLFVITMRFH